MKMQPWLVEKENGIFMAIIRFSQKHGRLTKKRSSHYKLLPGMQCFVAFSSIGIMCWLRE